MVTGASWAGVHIGFCLVLFLCCNNTERSAATDAPKQQRRLHRPVQPGRIKRTHGASLVPNMTRLFAGGLRSRGSVETRRIEETDGSGRVGANLAFRLEQTNSHGDVSHSGRSSHTVLGQGAFDRRTIEQAVAYEAAHLLPAFGNTLGFGRPLSKSDELE